MKRHASMNRAYRLVWSLVLDAWTAVAENARGRGKGNGCKLLVAALMLSAPLAHASPSGGQVTAGQGTITQSGSATTITQGSQNLSLRWDGFNTAAGESVNFVQPSANAIAVNRIVDTNGTKFLGTLNANGQVYLINPNGILFGAGAQVNVGGLVASTLDISDASLSSATRTFSGTGTGSVVNQGTINGRYVALLGNTVRNQGTITTAQGVTALGAGSAVTLTFADTSLVRMQVDQSTLDNLAENGGLIRADGGMVLLTAGAKNALLASVVNNTGVIEARSVQNVEGTIVLDGGASGTVTNSGTLDASGKNAGETGGTVKALGRRVELLAGTNIDVSGDAGGGTALIGGNYQGKGPEQNATTTTIANGASINADAITNGDGGMIVAWSDGHTSVDGSFSARGGAQGGNGGQVETSGKKLTIGNNTRVNALAPAGKAGNWLLDPVDFTIGCDAANCGAQIDGDILDTTLSTNLDSAPVTIQSSSGASGSNGDIFVKGWVNWSANTTLTLSAYRNIAFDGANSGITPLGSAANILFRADNTGTGTGTIVMQNGAFSSSVSTCTSCSATISIYYNPSSYASPTNFLDTAGNIVFSGSYNTLNTYMLVHIDNTTQNVTYNGTTNFTPTLSFDTTKAAGTPTGATLNVGTATVSSKNVGTQSVSYSGYSASGSVTAGGATGYYYLAAQPTASLDIQAKTVTLTAPTVTKTYDGGTTYTTTAGNLATLSGSLVGSDTVTAATIAYADKNAGSGNKTVNLNSVTISDGNSGNNYSVTLAGNSTSTINQANLTVTASQATKTYDGTTSASGNGSITSGALGTGDVVNAAATQVFLDKSAGTNKTVRASGLTIKDGGSADMTGNYNISYTDNTTSTINQANLTVTASQVTKAYDGTTSATGTGSITSGALGTGDVVNAAATQVFLDKNAGANKTVRASGLTIKDGGSADMTGNYNISYADDTTSTINQKAVTLTAPTITKTYDGGTTYTTTAGNLTTLAGSLVGSDTVTAATIAFADKNAGTGNKTVNLSAVTISDGNSGNNYSVTLSGNSTSTINQKAVTLTAPSVTKTYDGGTTYTTTAGNLTTLSGSLVGSDTVTAATIAYADKDAGTGNKTVNLNAVTISDGNSGNNYSVTLAGNGTSTIDQKALTLSGITADNKAYDGATSATLNTAGVTFAGLVGGDSVSLGGAGVGNFADKNVGTGKTVTVSGYTLGGADAGNYSVGQPTGLTANITPAAIAVSGITASNKTYDGSTSATVNTAGASFTGMVGGDALTVSATGAFADKNVGTGKTVNLSSTYGGADAGNYSFTDQASTTADITAKSVTLAAPSVSKTYDGGTSYAATAGDLTALAGSLLGGDTVTAATIAYTDKNAGTNKTVNLSAATINDGNSGNNYNATLAGNSTSTITAKGLSVAANAASKTYDGLAYSGGNGVTYSGFAAGDTAGTVLSGTLSYGGTSQGAVNPGTFTIVPGGLTSNANYTLSFVDGALTILEAAAPATARAPAPAQQPQTVKDATTSLVAAASQPVTSGPSQTLTVKQLADASSGEGGGSNPDSGGGSDSESGSGNGIGINTQMLSGGLGPTLQIVNGGIRLPGNMVSISE